MRHALAVFLFTAGCSSPLAPSSTPQSAQLIDVSSYLIPTQHFARTGAHEQSLWWDGRYLTIVKGLDPSQLEQWEFRGDKWIHIYDKSDGTGTAYKLLPGDWFPAQWQVGDTRTMLHSELVRYSMDGFFLERVQFPYALNLSACYDALDVGGIVGTVPVIDVTYQPLQVNGQPHAHPNTEIFRFAKGYGLVGWKADWDPRGQWLTFTEAYGPPVPPGFMVEIPSR